MATNSKPPFFSNLNVITIGDLIQKDLEKAYFLPQQPSSYSKGYRFQNSTKYQVFDSPPPPLSFNQTLFPLRNLATTGDKIQLVMESEPPSYLQEHWNNTMPDFPLASVKSVDEALLDDIPIVTSAALQSIPEHKQSIHPDLMYKLQLKSSILEIGVPVPKHMEEDSISFPCVVKADMGWCGRGSQIVRGEEELTSTTTHIRDLCGWDGRIVFQEFIPGVKEVPSFQFHLSKSGEMFWVGTTHGKFDGLKWIAATVDWRKQEEYRDLVHEEFTIPIKNYLLKNGYFGLVTFEVLFTDHGKFMVDLNPRVGGETSHLLLARYMASVFGLKHSAMFSENTHNVSGKWLVQKANGLNEKIEGRIVILAVADEPHGCNSDVSVFAQSAEEVQDIFGTLTS